MKKIILTLTAIFICTIAYAENITINWGVDNQTYTTTTCEIGGDVILPSVSKRGHIFRGWTPEHFDRGTFANWDSVPTDINSYQEDTNGNKKPYNGDFIVINNAYEYCSNNDIENIIYISCTEIYLKVTYLNSTNTYNIYDYQSESNRFYVDNLLSAWLDNRTWAQSLYAGTDGLVYNGKVYNTGDFMFRAARSNGIVYSVYINCPYTTPWRFVYDGVWETDGKNGWKPDYQITSNQDE